MSYLKKGILSRKRKEKEFSKTVDQTQVCNLMPEGISRILTFPVLILLRFSRRGKIGLVGGMWMKLPRL